MKWDPNDIGYIVTEFASPVKSGNVFSKERYLDSSTYLRGIYSSNAFITWAKYRRSTRATMQVL